MNKKSLPEKKIYKFLQSINENFASQIKNLPGKPDFLIENKKLILNINGCYWHNHGCIKSNIPKTRTEYWLDKLENNKKRDFQNKRKLIRLGWRVVDVWECTLDKKNLAKTIDNLERMIAA